MPPHSPRPSWIRAVDRIVAMRVSFLTAPRTGRVVMERLRLRKRLCLGEQGRVLRRDKVEKKRVG